VVEILSNATTVFIIGEKFEFNDPNNIKVVNGVMEVRRIGNNNVRNILLLKTAEYYDSIQ
jgi:hypothetical protein